MSTKKNQSRQLTDREQLAWDIYIHKLGSSSKTPHHLAVMSLDLAAIFFDEMESRRKPIQEDPRKRIEDKPNRPQGR